MSFLSRSTACNKKARLDKMVVIRMRWDSLSATLSQWSRLMLGWITKTTKKMLMLAMFMMEKVGLEINTKAFFSNPPIISAIELLSSPHGLAMNLSGFS